MSEGAHVFRYGVGDGNSSDENSEPYSDDWSDDGTPAGSTPRGGGGGGTPRGPTGHGHGHHHHHAAAANAQPGINGGSGIVAATAGQGFQWHTTFDDEDPYPAFMAGAGHAQRAQGVSPDDGDQAAAAAAAAAGAGAGGPRARPETVDDDERVMDDGGGAFDEDYEPTDAEIMDYCEWLGVDPVADRPLMWIVREALKAPLPEHWRLCYTEDRELYYFNVQTGESIWDHPLDAFYKALYKQEKAKLLKKRQCMRHFSGSIEVQPLAHFFSELGDDEGVAEDANALENIPEGCTPYKKAAPWAQIPEALVDAIDFRIYVEPVVLPTSGRTVSRHTIINTRWRDPFSREYVENRRLVPNVDKRGEVDAWLGQAVAFFFDHLEPSAAGLRRALRILPYLVDKEEEMCLRGQQRFFAWLKANAKAEPKPEPQAPLSGRSDAGPGKALRASGSGANAATTRRGKPDRQMGGTLSGSQAPGRRAGVAASTEKKSQTNTPRQAKASVLDLIETALDDAERGKLFTALLTMATSTSRECLYFVLSSKPALASHAAFLGFSDEVLHVLYVGNGDLAAIAKTVADSVGSRRETMAAERAAASPSAPGAASAGSTGMWAGASWANGTVNDSVGAGFNSSTNIGLAPNPPSAGDSRGSARGGLDTPAGAELVSYETTNSEHVLALQWVAGLGCSFEPPVNALQRLDFGAALHLIFAMNDSRNVNVAAKGLCELVRGTQGWPAQLGQCPEEAVAKLFRIALDSEDPAGRVRMLFDVAWSGGERCLEVFKDPAASARVTETVIASVAVPTDGESPYTPAPEDQSADLFSAILIYHDCITLEALAAKPALALRVGYNLLPRLTRSQWRPKHFDATVQAILALIQSHPVMAWRTMQTAGALFLLKELSKKKRNAEDTRLKIGSLEAVERRHQQSNAINNWGLLASRLLSKAAGSLAKEAASAAKPAAAAPAAGADAPAKTNASRSRFPAVAPRPSPRGAPPKGAEKAGEKPPPPPPVPAALQRLEARAAVFAEGAETCATRRNELHAERAGTLVIALQTLVSMRLKPKPARMEQVARLANSKRVGSSEDTGDRAATIAPPLVARRTSNGGRPPSGPAPPQPAGRRNEAVSSSCPNLPPIAPPAAAAVGRE